MPYGDGCEQRALRHRLAAAGDAMDQVPSVVSGSAARGCRSAQCAHLPPPAKHRSSRYLNQTDEIVRLRYMTDPLPEDLMVVGRIAIHVDAAIDQADTCRIAEFKDVGPDLSMNRARRGRGADEFARARTHPRRARGLAVVMVLSAVLTRALAEAASVPSAINGGPHQLEHRRNDLRVLASATVDCADGVSPK
jgi:hypothetical protein